MRLLVLGASGGCGRWATSLAAERGHDVRVLIRDTARLEATDRVEVVRGSVLEREVLTRSLENVDAVLSCLGLRRRNPRDPWSRVTSPPTLTETVARMLVEEMPSRGVSRLVAISAGGVGESAGSVHPLNAWLFRRSSIAVAYRDLERMEAVLGESSLDWHAVRPTTLSNGPPTGRAVTVDRYGLLSRVRRADVATWMLDTAERGVPPGESRAPMIATCLAVR